MVLNNVLISSFIYKEYTFSYVF